MESFKIVYDPAKRSVDIIWFADDTEIETENNFNNVKLYPVGTVTRTKSLEPHYHLCGWNGKDALRDFLHDFQSKEKNFLPFITVNHNPISFLKWYGSTCGHFFVLINFYLKKYPS